MNPQEIGQDPHARLVFAHNELRAHLHALLRVSRLMLLGKIDSARNRLEALMARLPADAADATDAADTSDTAASTDPVTSAAAK